MYGHIKGYQVLLIFLSKREGLEGDQELEQFVLHMSTYSAPNDNSMTYNTYHDHIIVYIVSPICKGSISALSMSCAKQLMSCYPGHGRQLLHVSTEVSHWFAH